MFLISIGYERRSIDNLISMLQKAGVLQLLDVRESAASRRRGFGKAGLKARIEEAGIEYHHLPIAGNPYRKARGQLNWCLGMYRWHLRKNPDIISQVAASMKETRVAFLCYERSHMECHRSVLLEQLIDSNPSMSLEIIE